MYPSQTLLAANITRMIKAKIMTWAGHVASVGEKRNAYVFIGKIR